MQIQLAGPADLAEVAALFDAYRQFYQRPADLPGARSFIAERLAAGDSVIFLARSGGDPVGFTQLYPVFSSTSNRPGRLWLLNDLYVRRDARRGGVGRALMLRARVHAEETGAVGLFLQTARDNHAGQRLYASLGWQRDDAFFVYELPLA